MKSVAFIPARGGSKGLHRKNIKIFNGKPLIYWAIRAAKTSKLLCDVVVTTDDEEIAEISMKYGANVPFIRPKALSEDLTTTEETLKHALEKYEDKYGKIDIAVFLTCTDIFRKHEWIDEAIQKLIDNKCLESVFSGHKTYKNYWEQTNEKKWVRLKDSMRIYSSRQIKTALVREDTGLACASRAELWRKGLRIGDNVEIILNDDSYTSIDIHTEDDFKLAEFAFRIRNQDLFN
tara:strand:- start:886 stop:1587 length:702 start_codon:yes stop_codon:yes gene_type:complete